MPENLSASSQPTERLDSWKEIARYLNRDESTVQRWEKREGMPVHRHVHAKRGSVYAYRVELDTWWQGRRRQLEPKKINGEEISRAKLSRPQHHVTPSSKTSGRRADGVSESPRP